MLHYPTKAIQKLLTYYMCFRYKAPITAIPGVAPVVAHHEVVVIEKDQDKNPLLTIGTHTDITSQKELEQEIERQRMFYEQILTNSPVEISVLDDRDTFLYVNPVAHLEDLSRKWMQGKTLSEVYWDPVQESAWSKIITTARKTGKLQSFEKVITDKDGLARYSAVQLLPCARTQVWDRDGGLLRS